MPSWDGIKKELGVWDFKGRKTTHINMKKANNFVKKKKYILCYTGKYPPLNFYAEARTHNETAFRVRASK